MTLGMCLLSLLGVDTSRVTSGLYMVVLGLGMGFLMQMTTLVAQNSVEPRDIGVASSSRLFFQQIGGSIGVSAFGAIFARRLTEALASVSPGVHMSTSGGQFDPATVRALPAAIQHDVYYAVAYAIHGVFLWAIPAAVAGLRAGLVPQGSPAPRPRPPGRRRNPRRRTGRLTAHNISAVLSRALHVKSTALIGAGG